MTNSEKIDTSLKKRILVVGPVPPPRGGIASLMLDLVGSELNQYYDFELFARQFTFPKWAKGPVSRNIIRALKYLRYLLKCIHGRYSLIHVHSPGHRFLQSAVYMLLARVKGIKTLLHLHGNEWAPFYDDKTSFQQFLILTGLRRASRIVVIRENWVEKLQGLGLEAKVSLLPNMIPGAKDPDPEDMDRTRRKLEIGPDDFVVFLAGAGAVGRDKGMLDILDAVGPVSRELDSVRFVVAGGEEMPGQMEHVINVIQERNLHKWMRIMGDMDREDVLAIMDIASVFLLPSYIEGMPISIMEAMRSSTPVVATPVGAIPEMIEHEDSGLIIRVGSPEDIKDAVLRIAFDDSLRDRLIQQGLETFHAKFDLKNGAQKVRMIYEELTN